MRPDGRQSHRDALTVMVTIYYILTCVFSIRYIVYLMTLVVEVVPSL